MSARQAVVYIVDDDPAFRKSLARLVRASGWETVAFESATSFLAQKALRHPACLLLDVQLPDMDGMTVHQELIRRDCRLPVIFMTGHGDIPMSVRAMKKGAVDFLPKPFETGDLRSAVRNALERALQDRKKELEERKARAAVGGLTPREAEVLRWVITGKLNKQIARALGTTEKTVKAHRHRVMQKTGAASVADLVRLAEKINILPAV